MGFLTPLLDLLFPPRCVICRSRLTADKPGPATCRDCLAQVPDPSHCCSWCGHPHAGGVQPCPSCRDKSFSFSRACAVSLYRGELKKTIHRFKYDGRKELADPLGKLMARQVKRSHWPEMDAVVPVPLHYTRLVQRGYDQALLLAHVIGDELRLPVKQILVRKEATPSQTQLDAKERWHNVADAFALAPDADLPGRVLLVDDLLTTGATAHFAGEALRRAGVAEIYLAVVAR
ncbi:MAG: ComF family protein [Bacillota bacterium]|nr:ComF family protein [Bacillota bacterium]MDW7682948.1 ComF family protein [Bacillota bacterium]